LPESYRVETDSTGTERLEQCRRGEVMSKRLIVLLCIAVGLLACYAGFSAWMASERSVRPVSQMTTAMTPRTPAPVEAVLEPLPEGYEDVVLTVAIPSENDALPEATSGHGPVCFQTKVSSILAMGIASPHGIIVGTPMLDGPADAAGVKRGDSIIMAAGEVVTCPSGLLPHIKPGAERRDVELTVRRRKATSEPEQPHSPVPE